MNSQDSIRQDQIAHVRSTLHVKKTHQEDKSFVRSNNKKKQPSPKGHEAFLKALVASGAEICIEKCSGDFVQGFLKHADKYTLSIEAGGQTRVIFKHDISEFVALTPRAIKESTYPDEELDQL